MSLQHQQQRSLWEFLEMNCINLIFQLPATLMMKTKPRWWLKSDDAVLQDPDEGLGGFLPRNINLQLVVNPKSTISMIFHTNQCIAMRQRKSTASVICQCKNPPKIMLIKKSEKANQPSKWYIHLWALWSLLVGIVLCILESLPATTQVRAANPPQKTENLIWLFSALSSLVAVTLCQDDELDPLEALANNIPGVPGQVTRALLR